MSLHLYYWVVGKPYYSKHLTVVAATVEEARVFITSTDIIKHKDGSMYDFDLNEMCDHGINCYKTWKQIIQQEEPIVHGITSGKMLMFDFLIG